MGKMNNPENQQSNQGQPQENITLTQEQLTQLLNNQRQRSQNKEEWWKEFGLNDEEGKLFSADGLNSWKENEKLSKEGRFLLKKAGLKAINFLFRDVDKNPDSEYQKNWNVYYHEQRLISLKDNLSAIVNNIKNSEMGVFGEDVISFIEQGVIREIARDRDNRELYHDMMGVWIKTATTEQLAQFTSQKEVAVMIAPLSCEVGGFLVSLAMRQYEQFLRTHLAFNKNTLSPSLFAKSQNSNTLILEDADRARFKNEFIETLKVLKEQNINNQTSFDFQENDTRNIAEYEDWEIDRAILYGMGIHSLVTLSRFRVLATANPQQEFVGSADLDKIGDMNPRHKWRLGRGKDTMMHIPEIFRTEIARETKPFFKRVFGSGWNPSQTHEEEDEYKYKLKKEDVTRNDEKTYTIQESRFKKFMSFFGIGDLPSRGDWRIKSISAVIKKMIGVDIKVDWEKSYSIISQYVGVGARFFYDKSRAEIFVEQCLLEHYFNQTKKFNLKSEEQNKYEAYISSLQGQKLIDFNHKNERGKIIEFKIATISEKDKKNLIKRYEKGNKYQKVIYKSQEKGLNYNDLLETKTLIWRGMNFYALLKRAPYDFLCNLQQMLPEILPESLGGDTIKVNGSKKDIFDYIDQNPDLNTLKLSSGDRKKLIDLQEKVKMQWGKANIPHLKRIYAFYNEIFQWGLNKISQEEINQYLNSATEGKDKLNSSEKETYLRQKKQDYIKEKIIKLYYHNLKVATDQAMLKQKAEIDSEDIDDIELSKILFSRGQNELGLIPYFESIIGNTEFGDDQSHLGNDGFFYRMARTWYLEMGHNLHPNTADVDWRFVFQESDKESGGTMSKRLWGDLNTWGKIIHDLGDLDHLLEHTALEGDLKKLYEFHGKLHPSEGVGGNMYAQQYAIATVVGRYFQEDWKTRIPFVGFVFNLWDTIGSLPHGESELSLSKIYGTRKAMSMNSDALRNYFKSLMLMGHLPAKGPWSYDMLTKSFGVDNAKFAVTEVIPKAIQIWGLFLLWKFIAESWKEMKGEKR